MTGKGGGVNRTGDEERMTGEGGGENGEHTTGEAGGENGDGERTTGEAGGENWDGERTTRAGDRELSMIGEEGGDDITESKHTVGCTPP